jgi:hypothetical protein
VITDKQKRQAWNEADTIAGESPEKWRRDRFGNRLRMGSYGTRGKFAWVVDYSRLPRADDSGENSRRLEAIRADTAAAASNHAGAIRIPPIKGVRYLPQLSWPAAVATLERP